MVTSPLPRKRSLAQGINSLLHEPVSTPRDSSPDHRPIPLWTLLLPLFSFPPSSIYLLTREISPRSAASFASPEMRIVYRLKNFIIRSRFSFVFQFDFYRAASGKRQVHSVVPRPFCNPPPPPPIPLRRSPSPPPSHLLAPIFNFELSSPTRTSLRGGIPAGGVSACIKGQLLFFSYPEAGLFSRFPRWEDFFVSIYRVSCLPFDAKTFAKTRRLNGK